MYDFIDVNYHIRENENNYTVIKSLTNPRTKGQFNFEELETFPTEKLAKEYIISIVD